MRPGAVLFAICLLLSTVPAARADSITFSSSQIGGQVYFKGTGSLFGVEIPITSVSADGKSVAVTGGTLGPTGWLQFMSGPLISANSTEDQFGAGGALRIIGMVPGTTTDVVLLTALFSGPLNVIDTGGGQLLLSGNIEATSAAPALLALFPGVTIPSGGSNITNAHIAIHGVMGSNGSFHGKAQAESLTTAPEPSAVLLFGSGLLGVAAFLKRKASSN